MLGAGVSRRIDSGCIGIIKGLLGGPKQGANTREILSDVGYSDDQIETMVSDGVAKDELSEHYLPHKDA
jgi:hypothetical protein